MTCVPLDDKYNHTPPLIASVQPNDTWQLKYKTLKTRIMAVESIKYYVVV